MNYWIKTSCIALTGFASFTACKPAGHTASGFGGSQQNVYDQQSPEANSEQKVKRVLFLTDSPEVMKMLASQKDEGSGLNLTGPAGGYYQMATDLFAWAFGGSADNKAADAAGNAAAQGNRTKITADALEAAQKNLKHVEIKPRAAVAAAPAPAQIAHANIAAKAAEEASVRPKRVLDILASQDEELYEAAYAGKIQKLNTIFKEHDEVLIYGTKKIPQGWAKKSADEFEIVDGVRYRYHLTLGKTRRMEDNKIYEYAKLTREKLAKVDITH